MRLERVIEKVALTNVIVACKVWLKDFRKTAECRGTGRSFVLEKNGQWD
jgi:hypothetical protein